MAHGSSIGMMVIAGVLCQGANGQCDREWIRNGGVAGVNGYAAAFCSRDLAGSSALWIGGNFTAAGPLAVSGIAVWDGALWSAPGNGFSFGAQVGLVGSIVAFDGGVVAGGLFDRSGPTSVQNVAFWNGAAWAPLGSGVPGRVSALAVYEGELYATAYSDGGTGPIEPAILRWNGETWVDIAPAGALDSEPVGHAVAATVHNGRLSVAYRPHDEIGATRVALWDGSGWEVIPHAADISITSMASFQGELYCGGTQLSQIAAMNLRKWNGSVWQIVTPFAFPPDDPAPVFELCVFDNRLWIAGDFPWSPSSRHDLWVWSGAQWALYGGMPGDIGVMAEHEGLLHIGGRLSGSGSVGFEGVAVWDGGWRALSTSVATNGSVYDFRLYGGALVVGGSFEILNGLPARRIASFDGAHWSTLGNGLNGSVYGLAEYRGELIALGNFSNSAGGVGSPNIATWNGSSWGGCGRGIQGGISRYAQRGEVMRDALFVCGRFDYVDGNRPVRDLARWDGQSWSGILTETGEVMADDRVHDIAVFEGDLIIGGLFRSPTRALGRYNGQTWAPMSGGRLFNEVEAVEVHEGQLYIAGSLGSPGSPPIYGVARWTGSAWVPVGGGIGPQPLIVRLVSTPMGLVASGLNLRLGHDAENEGETRSLLLWDGQQWLDIMGEGTDFIFGAYGNAGSLFVGGTFDTIGGVQASRMAEWRMPLDTDRSGAIDLADFFAYLSGYFSALPWADWNDDRMTTAEDLFGFLSDWFAGCP